MKLTIRINFQCKINAILSTETWSIFDMKFVWWYSYVIAIFNLNWSQTGVHFICKIMQNHVSDFFENQKHVLCEIKTLWFTLNDFKDGFYFFHCNFTGRHLCFKLDHARSSIRLIQDHDFDINYKTRNGNPDSETHPYPPRGDAMCISVGQSPLNLT